MDKNRDIEAVVKFAQKYDYEQEHSLQVTKLALNLFDELEELHGLSERDRFVLESACVLHDIGWIQGQKKHHKTALKLILGGKGLPLSEKQRQIAALIARYHRKALPKPEHELFGSLGTAEQEKVKILGGILRLADGLDRSHCCVVKKIKCEIDSKKIVMNLEVDGDTTFEIEAGTKKSDLLSMTFGRQIKFSVVS